MFFTSKRFWKRFFIVAAIAASLLFIAFIILNIWVSSRLESRLAKLRATGEPTSIRELEVSVPNEGNAALILSEIRPQLEAFTKAQVEFEKTAAGMNYREFAYIEQRPSVEQIAAIRTLVEKFPGLPAAIDLAASSQHYVPLIDYSRDHLAFQDEISESFKLIRTVGRFNSLRVEIALAEGKLDDAAGIGINMLKFARLQDSQPLLVSGLLGFALRGAAIRELDRVLRAGELSPELYSKIDQELALHDDSQMMVNLLKTERAYNLDASHELCDHFFVDLLGKLLQIDILDFHEQAAPIMAKPWKEAKNDFHRLETQSYGNPITNTNMALMMPGLSAAHDASQRTLAQLRCLRILNALQAYKATHDNEVTGLDDLDLPKSASIDPFSGEPLKLKMTNDGWVIYSVMQNGVDDGGNFHKQIDWGVAPIGYPDSD